MSYLLLIPVALFSALAFWKPNPVFYLLIAITSIAAACEFPGNNTTSETLSISVALFMYAIFAFVMVFRYLVWPQEETDEEVD